jgi:hypothetical protein
MNQLLLWFLKTWGITKREALYRYALSCVGRDMAPTQDEYGCAEAVTTIIQSIFPGFLPVTLSTASLYQALRKSPRFVQVKTVTILPGDIIISPTGQGNGMVPNGHVGIFGLNSAIMSNSSTNGKFEYNYTLGSWIARYNRTGGYPVYVFRVLY